jgi:transposase
MPKEKLSMLKTKEILRLKHELGLSNRKIAAHCGITHVTVADYLRRADRAGLGWPLPEGLSETQLQQCLFPSGRSLASVKGERRALPDWSEIHRQLRRKGVTLMLLWQEYKECHPEDGYQYSQFAHRYQQWLGGVDVVMRQTHRAGEKRFVDYAGQTMEIIDRHSGESRTAEIFVAVLGASNYTYTEASWSQSTQDWVSSPIRAFEFFGGCAEVLSPDNLKAAVNKPHRYEPQLNATYADMARHYQMAMVPARVARPQDKSKVENGVQRVEQWILARLRDSTFFSLGELNERIAQLRQALNSQPFQKLPGSRRSQFEALDLPALRPLPAQRYEYAQWLVARVAPNSHIRVEQCYYSVPYQLVKKQVEVRLTARLLEVLFKGERVASHLRNDHPGSYPTTPTHLPEGHQRQLEWTPQRLLRWAAENGPATAQLIQAVLDSRPYPQQAFNACLGVMRLGKSYGGARLEAACRRALHFGTLRYKSLESILKNGLDQQPLPAAETAQEPTPLPHKNLRGSTYYH